MLKVDFHPPDYLPECGLKFVIIGSRMNGRWLFIRHKLRKGLELPAGHIDKDENPDDSASRELREETGASDFSIKCISTYTVAEAGKERAGRLYLAEIRKAGGVPDKDEIDEVIFSETLPDNLTFPVVQKALFDYLEDYIKQNEI